MKLYLHSVFAVAFFFVSLQTKAQKLAVIPYVSGISSPIDLKYCGDDRLFVADRTGLIRIIDTNGVLRPAPFLDITSKISSTNSEEGFLGFAFSPNYKTSRKFYVYYTSNIAGQLTSIIEEYKANAADSNVADISSELPILTQSQPASNHNGGNLMFGKDGFLYINFGDGGSEGDPDAYGQNRNTFLAKILRIDVSNSSIAQPYVVPVSNPFYNDATPGIKKEIWAYGVRNPWRSSVDRLTGDLWIADVGQDAHEEIDYQPGSATGGRNYGWNIMEGNSCYKPTTGCDMTGLALPLYDYPHSYGACITGGYVYRSAQSKSLFGTYIFGDYIAKWIDGITAPGGVVSVTHLIAAAQATGNPICFGEDRYGDEYILFNGDGTVYKLQDTSSLRRPKAWFTTVGQAGSILFQGLPGRNLTYQWLRDNTPIPGATSPDYITSAAGAYKLVVTNTLNLKDTSLELVLDPLPLRLISFTAQKIAAGKIGLQWKTASEQNISGYTIMRKQNNEPAFSTIGFVRSKSPNGISSRELDYTFTDSSAVNNSTLFYRLQVQNSDGSYTWSDIRTITSRSNTTTFNFSPNPAKDYVQVYINNFTQPAILVIYDNIGKKIKEQSLNQQNSTIRLPLPKGLYIMQLSNKDGSNIIRGKLMVE